MENLNSISNKKRAIFKYSTLIILQLLLVTSCSSPSEDKKESEQDKAEMKTSVISLSSDQASAIELTTVRLEKRNMQETIKATGIIDLHPNNRAMVSPKAGGFVKRTMVIEGDVVKKGQTLAVLENQEYIKIQQEYLEMKSKLSYLKSEYDRQKSLDAEKINAKKNLLQAEAEYLTVKSKSDALKQQIEMLHLSPAALESGSIVSEISVLAPISGFVTKSEFAIGQFVDGHEVIFEIMNTDHLHAELHIFEKDIFKIKKGQRVTFKVPNINDVQFNGEVYLVGKAFDKDKKVILVHVHLSEEVKDLIPGVYVDAEVFTGGREVFALPANSIVRDGENKYIFIRNSNKKNTFERVSVSTGVEFENWVEVNLPESLKESAEVVANGSSYLLTAKID